MFTSKRGSLVEPMIAGAMTGGTQTILFYPLDVVRARQQVDFAGKLVKDLWKGVLFSTVLTMVKRGATVVVYESVDRASKQLIPHTPHLQNIVAGAMAGMFEAVLIQPFNVLRLRVQTDPNLRSYRGALAQLMMNESPFSLYNGFLYTTAGNIVWWVTCPALYRSFQRWMSTMYAVDDAPDKVVPVWPPDEFNTSVDVRPPVVGHVHLSPPRGTMSKYQMNLVCGLSASFLTTLISLPLSRLASLMYQVGEVTASNALRRCLREGKMSFFKGWIPTFIRMVRGRGHGGDRWRWRWRPCGATVTARVGLRALVPSL